MNKKAITAAVLLSLAATTSVGAANVNTKLVKYQNQAVAIANQSVEAHEAATAQPGAVTVNLPQSVELALANNRTLRQSQWAYEGAAAQVSATAAQKNPQLSYSYDAQRAGGVTNNAGNRFGHQFNVKTVVYSKEFDAAIESARFNREGAGATVTATAQTTKLQAATNYLTLIKNRNKVDVANQTVKDYEEHLRNVNLQYEVGIVAKSDVLATNTTLANARTSLVKAQNTADLSESTFNNQVGLPVNTKVTTSDRDMGYTPYNVSLEQATTYALYHRAEILKAAMDVKSAEESVTSAKAGSMPTVSASASRGMNDDTWAGTGNKSWSIGGSVSWSLWDGGQSRETEKVRKASLEAAKEAQAETIESVQLGVRQAYLNMKSAEQTIVSTRTAVEEGQENFRIASLRYRSGVGTNVDVLDAETALATARDNYIDALYNYNIAVATLEQQMGVPLATPVAGGAEVVNSFQK